MVLIPVLNALHLRLLTHEKVFLGVPGSVSDAVANVGVANFIYLLPRSHFVRILSIEPK